VGNILTSSATTDFSKKTWRW